MREWVAPEYRDLVTTQSYGAQPRIDGVKLIELRAFHDEGGDFLEVVRLSPEGEFICLPGYRPAQISYSLMEPGTVKAFHLHERQDDVWFVPPGDRVLVGLLDTRQDSTSSRTSMRFTLGAGAARLLLIPRGVAHGLANLSRRAVCIMYFSNHQFDPQNPDEHRLPHDILGADFWTIRPG
jgi:dTDP-4-dehydrorhamnose 3,5-epimerase